MPALAPVVSVAGEVSDVLLAGMPVASREGEIVADVVLANTELVGAVADDPVSDEAVVVDDAVSAKIDDDVAVVAVVLDDEDCPAITTNLFRSSSHLAVTTGSEGSTENRPTPLSQQFTV